MPLFLALPLPPPLALWRRDAPAEPAPRRMMPETAEDEALMRAAAGGDRSAFGLLVHRHGARVLRLALRVLGQPAEAEEVAQEALLRAWQAAGSFDPGRARFTTWLHRIVVNLAIDRARRLATAGPRTGPEALEAWPDPGPDPEAQAASAQQEAGLRAALARLAPKYRAAIALAYEEGLSGAEAAAALGLSERALEGVLYRARQALRRHLEEGS
ncbi:sigma-70 family RNA polymerase sigma factor [Siccirubricoccus sp. KC 17139]|uniref:RNA polymerase sigma factor n=1 Tax=Siccirubricoccus soli TaxID=2899147 RepID=A0ABT1DA33_9PROT|nr:sigma-70 family RNA polymerase sigma factor [Siccirubricoccus soli]MCO6417855.1 sigma-70 family RNA polymerase sigma factor [Siccirubricoccus soli]MCP2683990.1 sigma-70 family RNA polymerase sigma factor [Siccirubricoccus soli]